MRLLRTAFVIALVLSAATELRASEVARSTAEGTAVPAAALLYLDQSHWQQAQEAQKIALATDFMRIFCGDPAMPPSVLVGCLDQATGSGPMFERALSCVATSTPLPNP
jgi:hypothetical protein